MTPTPSATRAKLGRYRLRPAVRWLVLVAAVALAWPLRTESSTSVFLPALSPFIAVAGAVSGRAVGLLALLAVPVLVLAAIYPRWFCRHGCPVGLLQEVVERCRPNAPRRWRRFPAIGKWLAWLTLGGALLGYPFFVWLDPLAICNGFLNAGRQPIAVATLLTGLGLPLLLLLDLVWPRLWCQRICPLGATQELLVWPRHFLWRHLRCRTQHSPRRLPRNFVATDVRRLILFRVREAGASLRRLLQFKGAKRGIVRDALASSFAPAGGEGDRWSGEGERTSTTRPTYGSWSVAGGRRYFLAVCAGAAGAFTMRTVRGGSPALLRPPGALDEHRFTGVCVRCGNCAQACPSNIIQPDFGASGVAGFLTPRLRFDEDYCRADCHRCNQVCPSGAIARLSLAEKRQRVIGPAVVDLDTCLLAQGRECTACVKRCPYEAIGMVSADGGFSNEPRVDLAKCTGCGACEAVCPVRPDRAIRVEARPGRLAENSTKTL